MRRPFNGVLCHLMAARVGTRIGVLRHRSNKGESNGRKETEHPGSVGRRHRLLEHQRLQPGHDGLQDAEHRPHCQGRCALHRLVRPAELHGRPGVFHHRPVRLPHRLAEGRPARREGRPAGPRRHDRRTAQGAGLHDRAVRQEPPGRRRRDAADRARVRRVLRLAVPPQRGAGVRERGLLQRSGDDQEVPDPRRDPLLGQRGRHAEDRKHRPARQEAHGDHRRRGHRRPRSTTWRRPRRRTSRSSSGGTPRACTSSPT